MNHNLFAINPIAQHQRCKIGNSFLLHGTLKFERGNMKTAAWCKICSHVESWQWEDGSTVGIGRKDEVKIMVRNNRGVRKWIVVRWAVMYVSETSLKLEVHWDLRNNEWDRNSNCIEICDMVKKMKNKIRKFKRLVQGFFCMWISSISVILIGK